MLCVSVCLGGSEAERRLLEDLFEDYNLKVRPARAWNETVMVRVGMTLVQLISLVGFHTHSHICSALYISGLSLMGNAGGTNISAPHYCHKCKSPFTLKMLYSLTIGCKNTGH